MYVVCCDVCYCWMLQWFSLLFLVTSIQTPCFGSNTLMLSGTTLFPTPAPPLRNRYTGFGVSLSDKYCHTQSLFVSGSVHAYALCTFHQVVHNICQVVLGVVHFKSQYHNCLCQHQVEVYYWPHPRRCCTQYLEQVHPIVVGFFCKSVLDLCRVYL